MILSYKNLTVVPGAPFTSTLYVTPFKIMRLPSEPENEVAPVIFRVLEPVSVSVEAITPTSLPDITVPPVILIPDGPFSIEFTEPP
jgi:hypothetical protein